MVQGQSGSTTQAFDELHKLYYCKGGGTDDYRVVIDAFVRGGAQAVSAPSTHYYQVIC